MTATSQPQTCNGQQLKALAEAGLYWLESHYQHVNELNVFPVPDGDTGTNMLMTMRNAYKEIASETSPGVGKVANKFAHGAMMGSRGNSGTILSQLWLGFARIIGDAETFDAPLMAKAMREATETAYRGVQRPVEGTILTVAREITEELEALVTHTHDLAAILEKLVARGWQSVEHTPDHLPILKKAGVVDSGGSGLVYVLEGMLRHLRGEEVILENNDTEEMATEMPAHERQIEHPGENIYDVQFVMKKAGLDARAVKHVMEQMGDSVVVVGSETAVKVHVHVRNPGIPLEYAVNVAPISDIVVENMLEQYEEFLREQLGEHAPNAGASPLEFDEVPAGQIAVIAVAGGAGMSKVFSDLGVAGIVNGGQTNNPSTQEMLDAMHALNTDKVILLPNNKNIILTAQQAAQLAPEMQVRVVPTRTFPQGVAAMFAYSADGNLDEVVDEMTTAKDEIITIEITRATRSVELDGVSVTEGQIIALIDGKLQVSGADLTQVAEQVMANIDIAGMELVTLYYGDEVTAAQAEALAEKLGTLHEDLEFDVVAGGQKHYHYIISIE